MTRSPGIRFARGVRLLVSASVACAFIAGIAVAAASGGTFALASSVAGVQLLPSLAKAFSAGLAGFGLAWLFTLALTALFGRFYCSALCPLGALQDAAAFVASRLSFVRKFILQGKNRRYARASRNGHSRPAALRLALAVVAIAGAAAFPAALGWLEPYSLATRLVAALFGTAWEAAGEALVGLRVHLPAQPLRPDAAWMAAAILPGTAVLVASVVRPRAFCRWLCPAGALLGTVSARSVFRFRIDEKACTSCGACERVCRSGAADAAGKRIDPAACVSCFDCVVACPTGAASYGRAASGRAMRDSAIRGQSFRGRETGSVPPSGEAAAPGKAVTRRAFLVAGGTGLAAAALAVPAAGLAAGIAADKSGTGAVAGVSLNGAERPWASPPGSGSVARFQRLCLSCGLCARACPSGVLRQGAAPWKFPAVLEPYMDYARGFCQFECVACGQACPTGAIRALSVERKTVTAVAKSRLDLALCIVVEKGTRCGACAEHCPSGALSMERVPRAVFPAPVLDPTLCIGCGACETVCPAEPKKALVVSGLAVHETARTLPERPGTRAQSAPAGQGAPVSPQDVSPEDGAVPGVSAPGGADGFPF